MKYNYELFANNMHFRMNNPKYKRRRVKVRKTKYDLRDLEKFCDANGIELHTEVRNSINGNGFITKIWIIRYPLFSQCFWGTSEKSRKLSIRDSLSKVIPYMKMHYEYK